VKGDTFILITKDIHNSIQKKTQIYTKTSESVQLGFFLAIVGGFLDSYTFICRGEVFANAQTGNIVLVGIELTKGNFEQALMAFFPIVAFIVGVIVAERLRDVNFSSPSFITGAERIILIIEIIVLIIIGFIPNTVPHIFTTVPISFVSSVQISCFRKLVDSPYCTTMCTGNLRSACQSAYIAFTRKDKKSVTTTIRYGIIIFSFLIGACAGGILTLQVGVKSIWFAALILIFSLCLYLIDEHRFFSKASIS